MVAILLLRHAAHDDLGKVLSGRQPVPLNESGRRQAEAVGSRLGPRPIRIHSSPQLRARQTAQIIAERLGVDFYVIEDLDEIDFGQWTGATFEALAGEPLWQDWNERRSVSAPPRGETMAAAVTRTVGHIEQLRGDTNDAILCVSHGDIIRGALAHYMGLGIEDIFSFDIAPASLSSLDLTSGATRVIAVNELVI